MLNKDGRCCFTQETRTSRQERRRRAQGEGGTSKFDSMFHYCNVVSIYLYSLTNKEPKKAEKRAAAPAPAAAVESGESQVKRGRGRPKGSGKKASGAAGASAAKSKVCFLFYFLKIIFSHSRITYYYTINFWIKLI